MNHGPLGERFRVDIGRAGDGKSFVRVVDTTTGLSKTQVGLDGEYADKIAHRLAAQIIRDEVATSKSLLDLQVTGIMTVDIYRDGGSYLLCFYSHGGVWYELFVPITNEGYLAAGHDPPELYFGSVNDGELIRRYTWGEAKSFLSNLTCKEKRFAELTAIVERCGRPSSALDGDL
jgi:hypothetical protein